MPRTRSMSSLMTTAAAREVLKDEDLLGEILAHLTPAHLAAGALVCSVWLHAAVEVESARKAAHSVAGLRGKAPIPAGTRVRVFHEGAQRQGVLPMPWADADGTNPSSAFELLGCDPEDRLDMLKAGRIVVALDSMEDHVVEPILASVADVEIMDHTLYRYLLRAQGGEGGPDPDPFAVIALAGCLEWGTGGLPQAHAEESCFYYGMAAAMEIPYAVAIADFSSGWLERREVPSFPNSRGGRGLAGLVGRAGRPRLGHCGKR